MGARCLRRPFFHALSALVLLLSGVPLGCQGAARAAAPPPGRVAGTLEADVRSELSHIVVRRQGERLWLAFVRDNGVEAIETILDTARPHEMVVPYVQAMFASYLFQPEPKRVLIVGLGGGAMVHFLRHYDPQLKVDVVEIDPAVVKIAGEHFGVRSGGNVEIVTADAFDFLAKTDRRYDVIYMDAFLKPSADTDATGMPLRLKTIDFYKGLHERLAPGGLVVVNLNTHRGVGEDLRIIKSAFPQVYVFRVGTTNLVAAATTAADRLPTAVLRRRAELADQRFRTNFSFQRLLGQVTR
jgi:spermidine synthase